MTRRHDQDLIAAAHATLTAYADGEPDPLFYLRDELSARGQLPGNDHGTSGRQR